MVVHRDTRTPDDHLGPLPRLSDAEIAALEAENGLLQFDAVEELVLASIPNSECLLTPDSVRNLQRIAVEGLEAGAGVFRTVPVYIGNSRHTPPDWQRVPELVEEMCAYLQSRWRDSTYLHLSAYAMWRMNWIHPFVNGNGRTSRAVSYYVMCAHLGTWLPGQRTVPDMISSEKPPYYDALDAADEALRQGRLDVSAMEELLGRLLHAQLS